MKLADIKIGKEYEIREIGQVTGTHKIVAIIKCAEPKRNLPKSWNCYVQEVPMSGGLMIDATELSQRQIDKHDLKLRTMVLTENGKVAFPKDVIEPREKLDERLSNRDRRRQTIATLSSKHDGNVSEWAKYGLYDKRDVVMKYEDYVALCRMAGIEQ